MRQKFAVVGITCFAGFYTASYIGSLSAFICFAVFIAAGLAACFLKKRTMGLILTAAAASFVIYGAYSSVYIEPAKSLCGGTYDITASVIEVSEPDNDTFSVTAESVIENTPVRLYFYAADTGISPGDVIDISVKLSEPVNSVSYNDNYNYSKGIFVKATALSSPVIADVKDRGIAGAISDYSLYLKEKTSEYLDGDEGALLLAMFFGDRSRLSPELSENIRRSGLSHMTAVSGMHISVMIGIITEILGFLGLNKRPRVRFIFVTITAAVFMLFFGMRASVVRSSLMLIIYSGAYLFRRKPSAFNSLGAALLIILLFEPCACRDLGLILSASGTVGAGVLAPYIAKKLGLHKENIIANILVSSLCAVYCTIPISVICFGGISTLSAISSVFITVPFYITLVCTLAFALTGGVFGSALLLPAGAALKSAVGVIDFFGSFRYAYISFEESTFIWFAVITGVFIVLVFAVFRSDRHRIYAAVISVCMMTGLALAEKLSYIGLTRIDIYSDGKDYLVSVNTDGGVSAFSSEVKNKLSSAARKALTDNCESGFLLLSVQAAEKRRDMYSESFEEFSALEKHYASNESFIYNVNDEYFATIEEESVMLEINGVTLALTRADELFESADIAILSGYKKNIDLSRVGEAIFCDKRYTDNELTNAYYSKVTVIINENGEYFMKGAGR